MANDLSVTRQSTHFPTSHRPGESTAELQARLSKQFFRFTDPLLAAAVQCRSDLDGKRIIGTTETKYSGSHILLTLLVRRALHLYRLPFHEDRCLTDAMPRAAQQQFLEIKEHLSPRRLDDMAQEVAALYAHTQHALAGAGLTQVRLRRHLNEPRPPSGPGDHRESHLFHGLVMASRHLGKSHLALEMDTLNSFSDDGGYAGRPINLTLDIPASEVLYCANLLGTADGRPAARADVESGEWVVINRAMDGVVSIPLTGVQVSERELAPHERYDDRERCEAFLRDYSRTYLRPSAAPSVHSFRGISYREKLTDAPRRSWLARLRRT